VSQGRELRRSLPPQLSLRKAEEAARLKKTREDVDDAGRLDVLELYKAAGPIFKLEQAAADGQIRPWSECSGS
jgi:hypothetical protein